MNKYLMEFCGKNCVRIFEWTKNNDIWFEDFNYDINEDNEDYEECIKKFFDEKAHLCEMVACVEEYIDKTISDNFSWDFGFDIDVQALKNKK